MSTRPRHLRGGMLEVLYAAVWFALLVGVSYGQTSQGQVDEVFNLRAIDFLKQGTFGPVTQKEIADAQAGQLVSILEAKFVTSQDAEVKARVARSLVDLGDKGNAYWGFLVEQANLAIESDVPSTRCFSSTNCTGHPAYVAWARAHNAPEDSQAEMELNWLLEERVGLVSRDPRGIPLLREALKSANINVTSTGADVLTRAHDKDSIPFIVEACKRFRDVDEVRLIASTLRRFKRDPDIRAVATAGEEQCVPSPAPVAPAQRVAVLKKNFPNTHDELDKVRTASALIGLGDKDDIYWDFLLRQATSLLESEASSAVTSDSQEKPIGMSTEETWVKRDREYNEMLTFVETVAEARDPRGIRLLRRALSSTNYRGDAAAGLVRAGDTDSIPVILDLCRSASPETSHFFALEILVYFDDHRAQSAVDQYLSKEEAKVAREVKANGVGPLGPWPPRRADDCLICSYQP